MPAIRQKVRMLAVATWLLLALAPPLAAQIPLLPEPQSQQRELPPLPPETSMRAGELPPAPYVAPALPGRPTAPAPPPTEAVLRPGETVTLRIRQVLPTDGLSPGERLLNSRSPIQPGDHFLAEVVNPPATPPALVGGTVTKVVAPGLFGRPGYVTLQLSEIVETVDGQSRALPWQINTADRRATTRMRRALITALLGFEGAGVGALIGAQNPNSPSSPTAVAIGAGAGLLVGLGYASFQRGVEANLEQGDTFQIVVNTTCYRPLPREMETILYPACDPPSSATRSCK
jgi:hypothetical protein